MIFRYTSFSTATLPHLHSIRQLLPLVVGKLYRVDLEKHVPVTTTAMSFYY
jgi:hypothetical protein